LSRTPKAPPPDRWVTIIAIACEYRPLLPYWKEIEHKLRMIAARVGWDAAQIRRKLEEIVAALTEIEESTPDWRNAPGDRFSEPRATFSARPRRRALRRAKSPDVPLPTQSHTPRSHDE